MSNGSTVPFTGATFRAAALHAGVAPRQWQSTAPCAANRLASTAPMPLVAPVTNATLFSSLMYPTPGSPTDRPNQNRAIDLIRQPSRREPGARLKLAA
jgi:hypothetical protein